MHMPKTYALTETFRTLQGEGANAGVVSLFVRFSGCNLWSGDADTRVRDAARTGSICPVFCDTDFRARIKLTEEDLLARIDTIVAGAHLVVLTGGEPLLQVSASLVEALIRRELCVAIETNGTQPLPTALRGKYKGGQLFVTCSPKVVPEELKIDPWDVSELKVVFPAYNPLTYAKWGQVIPRWYVSPEAVPTGVGVSVVQRDIIDLAVKFCMSNPRWRLSTQQHKQLGLR
jgi:organic radical activating enzyme